MIADWKTVLSVVYLADSYIAVRLWIKLCPPKYVWDGLDKACMYVMLFIVGRATWNGQPWIFLSTTVASALFLAVWVVRYLSTSTHGAKLGE